MAKTTKIKTKKSSTPAAEATPDVQRTAESLESGETPIETTTDETTADETTTKSQNTKRSVTKSVQETSNNSANSRIPFGSGANEATQQIGKNLTVILTLLFLLLGSAYMVVEQSFSYRLDYRNYNKLLHNKEELNAEWGRLLIEQQTFGATAQIGSRAVLELRMYSPPAAQSVVVASQ